MLNDHGLLLSIFKDAPQKSWIELRTISREGEAQQFFYHDPLQVLEKAEEFVDTEHCYFGIASRKNRAGKAEDVSHIGVIWADLDAKDFNNDKLSSRTAISLLTLPPTYVVDSGHGYHAYWLLDKLYPAKSVCDTAKLVAEAIGGDHVYDASRIMRLPGTYNHKDAKPIQCTVVEEHPEIKYQLADITRATKISTPTRVSILTGAASASSKDKTRSGIDWAVGTELKSLGMTDQTMRLIWEYNVIGGKSRERGEDYLANTIEKLKNREVAHQIETDPAACFSQEADTYSVIGVGRKGQHVVSTFTFEPRRLLEGDEEDVFLGDIHADGHVWEGLQLAKSSFLRVETLMSTLGRAAWQWLGTDTEVRFLLPYLVKKWKELGSPKAKATPVLGRHDNVWVAPNFTFNETEILDTYNAPIVYTPTRRSSPNVLYPEGATQGLFETVYKNLPKINTEDVIWPILGWFMACPCKPIFNANRISFPHLALYGTTGAGKTATLEAVFMPLLGYEDPAHSEDCSTTPFVLMSLLASTNAIPISLAEFRRTSLGETSWKALLRILLLSYDVGHDSRGRASQTTVDYPLHAPVVLSGEDIVADPAVQRRSIIIGMTPRTIMQGTAQYEAFMSLTSEDLNTFALPYIRYTLKHSTEQILALWNRAYAEVDALKAKRKIDERTHRNFATILFGVRMYEAFMIEHNVSINPIIADMLMINLNATQNINADRGYILIDSFVEDVINEAAKASSRFVYTYDKEGVLWFHLTTALTWWRRERLVRKEAVLDSPAVKRQLRELSINIPGDGHYVLGPKTKAVHDRGGSHRMYGVNVKQCFDIGMDVPEALDLLQRTITFVNRGE